MAFREAQSFGNVATGMVFICGLMSTDAQLTGIYVIDWNDMLGKMQEKKWRMAFSYFVFAAKVC